MPLPNPGRPRQLFSIHSLPTYGNSAARDLSVANHSRGQKQFACPFQPLLCVQSNQCSLKMAHQITAPYVGRMLCELFFWFLRCGEFLVPDGGNFDPNTSLSLTDISLDTSGRNSRFMLSIKMSKTNQFRNGTQVVLGATNLDLCPVAALLD